MNDNAPRVVAFADWLASIPASPAFYTRDDFAPFSDLTDDEMDEAMGMVTRRAIALKQEAGSLRVERKDRFG